MKCLIYITLYIPLIFSSLNVNSQNNNELSTRDRIFWGGSFGLMFGTYTQVELSPYVGYRITAPWAVGLGGIYQYYGSSETYGNYSTSIYGTNLFTKYTLIRDFPSNNVSLFSYAGWESINLENKYFSLNSESGRFWLNSLLVGGGFRQYLGGRTSMEILILYNLTQQTLSPYNNPTIRIAINF